VFSTSHTHTRYPTLHTHTKKKLQAGRQFRLLGAVSWGSLFAAAHWLDDRLQPVEAAEAWLASQGLLDAPPRVVAAAPQGERAAAADTASAPAPLPPRREDELTWREKVRWAEDVKAREVAELAARMERQEEEARRRRRRRAAEQGVNGGDGGASSSPSSSWWPSSWWRRKGRAA
jgi:hypothetical protein